ncbi:hypothetical protein PR001_g16217 [Phytophthora rubi]|uniref:Uncharacterized protein n=1 Tax=Phytophthora rubi TaxID=129364 RepID=A0A6A3KXU2_9STRA|nr:hypothetical protein PR001_g16217 [Phytophthora rubi]
MGSDLFRLLEAAAAPQQQPTRRLNGSLAPSFPQSQAALAPLGGTPVTLRTFSADANASASSSPLSSSSSTAADVVGPAQPWVVLMERRGLALQQEERGERHVGVKKRAGEGEQGAGGEVGEKPKRKRKYRKGTHTIRKEEKERLLDEMEELKAKIADLRSHTKGRIDESKEIIQRKFETGRALREGVKQRQQVFSQLSSIMSEYTLCTIQSGSPLQDFIYLKKDEQSRQDTLAAIKARKMEKAQRFMQMRRPNLDPCNTMGEERRYEAENGDFCSTRFTVTQFEDAQSVKQVFDLLLFYFCNIEISISEKIGHITIREDDGADDKGIVQNRLVSITHKDVKLESMFSQYFDRSADTRNGQADSSYGLIVADFVDEDERHPYVPSQRVRRDVNAVLEIREFTPQRPKSVAGGSPTRNSVVVLSRWVQNRMHYPKFPVCTDGWYELRDNMDLWGRALHRTIAENLRGQT